MKIYRTTYAGDLAGDVSDVDIEVLHLNKTDVLLELNHAADSDNGHDDYDGFQLSYFGTRKEAERHATTLGVGRYRRYVTTASEELD
jgi:hypothetical protein